MEPSNEHIYSHSPLRRGGRTISKTYSPHIVVVWTSDTTVVVKEYPYQEDAEEKYEELIQVHVQKITLAKVVKKHGEG
jgi:hypothetical protein